jgi:hypothetical protein
MKRKEGTEVSYLVANDRGTHGLGFEFTWACGPPMGMKVLCYGSLIPNTLPATFDGVGYFGAKHDNDALRSALGSLDLTVAPEKTSLNTVSSWIQNV